MVEYSVTFARSARKELETLDASLVARIFDRTVDIVAVRHRRDAYK
jgi:mRNA-degrading endonuclease RelE of RelBE toxin-antitoxin system